jgi:hypothetical protein
VKSLAEREQEYADYVCANSGHVWLESDSGLLYTRNHQREEGTTSVFCRHCGLTAAFQTRARFTAAPPPIDLENEYADVPAFQTLAGANPIVP